MTKAEQRKLVLKLSVELAEAKLTILNERGDGHPPGPGWERNDIDPKREGVAWYRRWELDGVEPGEDDTSNTVVAWVRRKEGCMVEWLWEIERSEGWFMDPPLATGRALTARAAMRACDTAAAGLVAP